MKAILGAWDVWRHHLRRHQVGPIIGLDVFFCKSWCFKPLSNHGAIAVDSLTVDDANGCKRCNNLPQFGSGKCELSNVMAST